MARTGGGKTPFPDTSTRDSPRRRGHRAHATACKLWPEADWVSASAPTTLAGYVDSIGDAGLVLDMLAGAQQRLMVYPQRGFMIEQHVPDDVAAAYERLRGAGFAGRHVSGEASS